jgi:hypothetical protein
VRQCYESSVEVLIKSLITITTYTNDSISKDLKDSELSEEDIMHLSMDPVLAKRMEKHF